MKKTIFLFALILICGRSITAQTNSFGSKEVSLISIKGSIYTISELDVQMPAGIETQTPLGVIYTKMIDVPDHEFTEGFPGVTDRFEFFGIIYTCVFEISKAGTYRWRIGSDDGSILWIDSKETINNDGIHPWTENEASIDLTAGSHTMKVWYFQGPATELGVQLFVTEPEGEEKIFNIEDYSASLSNEMKKVNAVTTSEGIKIKLPSAILFDVGKSDLKPEATETMKSLVEVINSYPLGKVKIEGYTDATGDALTNQKLSEDRAKSVLASLQKLGVSTTVTYTTVGMGSTKPVASNDTEEGKAQNRRVEVIILP
jgi:outer membrane protein OmpA-like peptidoglycan-associated protein